MGLSTTSYSKITALPEDWNPPMVEGWDGEEDVDWDFLHEEGIDRASTLDSFPRAMDGLEGGSDPDPLFPGHIGSRWYRLRGRGPGTDTSYSGHSLFRDALVAAFWSEEYEFSEGYASSEPFVDLIYFADNQGILGPEACARLDADFRKYPETPTHEALDSFKTLYKQWRAAVEHASDGGCIRFH